MSSTIKPTIALSDAAAPIWDVIIIGAGVAGGACALLLSRAGLSTLLVDKAQFPRAKACGCCINPAAINALRAMKLDDQLTLQGAIPLREVRVLACGRWARITAGLGISLSRKALDATIINHAIQHGTSFLPGVAARVGPTRGDLRCVNLGCGDQSAIVRGKVVVVADGLGGRSLDSDVKFHPQVCAGGYMGVAAIVEDHSALCPRHAVMMICGHAGYVGMVRLEDGLLNIAAALSPSFIKSLGGAGPAVSSMLRQAGIGAAPAAIERAEWMGTPLLTRRRAKLAGERLFVVGDSAGYIEPITGEGMAWALCGAFHLAPLVTQAVNSWQASQAATWVQLYHMNVTNQQWPCRLVSSMLRRPMLTRCALEAARCFPRLAQKLIGLMLRPSDTGERYECEASIPGHGIAGASR